MPVASYLAPNDYQVAQAFRPYQLDYGATLQEIATKNAYWEQGASRIKSALTAAIGLDPQYKVGQEYLKSFNDEAQKKLQKVGQSDLSQQDNVSQALGIFSPLYDTSNNFNRALLTDVQLNKYYKEQGQLSAQYRIKDGGKEWHKDNDNYYKYGQQEYLKDAQSNSDYGTVDKHWQSKKSFIPYYDMQKEVMDIAKGCHEDGIDNKTVADNNLYFSEHSYSGVSPQKMQGCFETLLSGRAKQQLGIHGFNTYINQPEVLLEQYQKKVVGPYQQRTSAIEAKILALKVGGVTKAEKDDIAKLTTMLKGSKAQEDDAVSQFNEMTNNNGLQFIKNNLERIATDIAVNKFEEKAGDNLSWSKVKNLLSPNAAGIALLNVKATQSNMYAKFNHDKEMAALDHHYALELESVKSQGRPGKKLTRQADGSYVWEDDVTMLNTANYDTKGNVYTEENLATEQTAALAKRDASILAVRDFLKEKKLDIGMDFSKGKVTATDVINFIDTYEKKKGVKDSRLTTLLGELRDNTIEASRLAKQNAYANQAVKDANPTYFNYDEVEKLGDTKYNGQTITGKDIARGMQNGDITIKYSSEANIPYVDPANPLFTAVSALDVSMKNNFKKASIYYKGNLIAERRVPIGGNIPTYDYTNRSTPIATTIIDAYNLQNGKLEKIREAKNKILSDDHLKQLGIASFNLDKQGMEDSRNLLTSRTGIDLTEYNITPFRDLEGNGYYSITHNNKDQKGVPLTPDEIQGLVDIPKGGMNQNVDKFSIGNNSFLKIGNVYDPIGSTNPDFDKNRLSLLHLTTLSKNVPKGNISPDATKVERRTRNGMNWETRIMNTANKQLFVTQYWTPDGWTELNIEITDPAVLLEIQDKFRPPKQ